MGYLIATLSPEGITLNITAPGHQEEVESWMEVCSIDERFKAKCCAKNDGKYWLEQVLEECKNYGITPQLALKKIQRYANTSIYLQRLAYLLERLLECTLTFVHSKGAAV